MDFAGPYAAVLTPFDETEVLDLGRLEPLVESLYAGGMRGLYVGGSTGEGLLTGLEERKALLERVVALSRGRGQVMAHVGAMSTREACELASHAAGAGADAVSSVPPMYYRFSPGEVKAHYADVASAAGGLPVVVYHIPRAVPPGVGVELMGELLEIRGVAGIKFSELNLYEERRLIAAYGEGGLTVFHGMDETLLGGLMMGAGAAVGGTYNIQPRNVSRLWSAWERGDWAEAARVQHRVAAVVEAIQAAGQGVAAMKAILGWRGLDVGRCRRPLRALTAEREAALRAALAGLERTGTPAE
jgi:N-acetylneuraminate lyase